MSKIFEALEHARQENEGAIKPQAVAVPRACTRTHCAINMENEMINLYREIEGLLPDSSGKVIQFIGSKVGEGSSSIVHAFAVTSAHLLGKKVLIIDANQDNPGQHLFFDIFHKHGWGDVLENGSDIEKAIYQVKNTSLYVCPTAQKPTAKVRAFDPDKIEHIFTKLKGHFDLVVVDSPPAAVQPDGNIIARKVDGTIMVLEADKTRWPVVKSALESVQNSGGNILGVVFNKQRHYIPDQIYKWL